MELYDVIDLIWYVNVINFVNNVVIGWLNDDMICVYL